MRNILVILVLLVCTSKGAALIISSNTDLLRYRVDRRLHPYHSVAGNSKGRDGIFNNDNSQLDVPTGNTVTIKTGAKVGNVYGAYMNDKSIDLSHNNPAFRSMTNNEVIVDGKEEGNLYDSNFHYSSIAGAFADYSIDGDMNVSSNTVRITGGNEIKDVYGGRVNNGTVSSNTVTISSSVDIGLDVVGGYVFGDGLASSNTVTITGGIIGALGKGNVCGGYIWVNGTATLNKVNLTSVTVTQDVFGGRIDERGLASSNEVTIISGAVKNVYGGYIAKNGTATLNEVNLTSVTVNSDVYGGKIGKDENEDKTYGLASSNTVTIISGTVQNVNGGFVGKGTATLNTVNLTDVDVTQDVFGVRIGTTKFERAKDFERDEAEKAEIFARDEAKEAENFERYEAEKAADFAREIEKAEKDIVEYFARIRGDKAEVAAAFARVKAEVAVDFEREKAERAEKFERKKAERAAAFARARAYGLASSNTVTITSGRVGRNVYGGYIGQNGTATLNKVNLTNVTVTKDVYGARIIGSGLASSNTVTINGGKVRGNVFGGYVGGNGKAIYNTITITGTEQSFPEFSTATILCGGICANKATADASTNDVFTGNTLNIETKGVVVKGISNFENYNFHLKDIKPGETILTATSGGCSLLDVGKLVYTPACKVDLSRSNIHLRTQSVLNKGECCTLIKSPQGFKDNIACKQFSFDNGGLVEYSWEIKIADNKQDLIATLNRKELREEEAKPLLEGNVTGMVCINNGMDCIISKMEETESVLGEGAKLQRKGEIGAFYGLLANKSSYDDTGSHIDMTGMSMMGGIGIGWKGLVTGAFGEYGTGNSDIDSGPCSCEKKSEGKSNYVGGGLLGRYNVCENEFSGTKLYLEAILRAGEVSNSFNSKEAKDGAEKECKYNDEPTMYGGCALGGGYKHKVGEKMDVDWSLRYMFGYQDGKDIEKPVDAYGNKVKLESVTSSRIRVGVRGKYVELEKVKPYIGIWYEHELSGKVKGAIQNGVDNVGDIPATSFEGGTGIGELGISGKVGKLDVGISGQGYLGVRKGFGGMLKLKYAFGKDAHAKPPKQQSKDK